MTFFKTATLALALTAFWASPAFAQEQENPSTPGQIPDPSTYQGSTVLQQQSDQAGQQYRQQQEQQQQQYPQQQSQSYRPAQGTARVGGSGSSRAVRNPVDPSHDTPAAAIRRGDYSAALRLARPKAFAGDAASQHTLAYLHETGSGVPLNFAIAASWNRKAADQGNVQGQADLGWMYFKGLGVSRDPVQAYKWLVLAGREDMVARRHMQEVATAITYDEMSQGLSLAQQWAPTSGSETPSTTDVRRHRSATR